MPDSAFGGKKKIERVNLRLPVLFRFGYVPVGMVLVKLNFLSQRFSDF
jgi:hypothetical protein